MSDDAVKAALVAAWRSWMTDPDDATPEHQAWAMRISAEAVAAFLRALPDRFQASLPAHMAINRRDPNLLHQLAAAVDLAAAREGSDDR